jgi:hypothetical protein
MLFTGLNGFRNVSSAAIFASRRFISRSTGLCASRGRADKRERQERRGQKGNGIKEAVEAESVDGVPSFAPLMRQIFRKMHPDLLKASFPTLSRENDASLQILNGILTSIKKYGEYPPQIVKNIPFHMLDSEAPGGTRLVSLRIKTAGGECKRQLTQSFVSFFHETGTLPQNFTVFRWDSEYFPLEAPTIRDYDSDEDGAGKSGVQQTDSVIRV